MKVYTLDKVGYRKFGLIMAVFITLIFGLFFPWVFNKNIPYCPWIVSVIFVFWALLAPNTLFVIYKPWMLIGHIIGIVNTKIILGVVFYVVFTPTALLLKVIGNDPLNRRFANKSIVSYWKTSKKQSKNHMENVY